MREGEGRMRGRAGGRKRRRGRRKLSAIARKCLEPHFHEGIVHPWHDVASQSLESGVLVRVETVGNYVVIKPIEDFAEVAAALFDLVCGGCRQQGTEPVDSYAPFFRRASTKSEPKAS